jgi:hypothetical protein
VTESLLVAGIVCIVASIAGGGVKLLGAEMPVLNSFPRQAMLFAVGAAFLFGSFLTSETKPSPPANSVSGPAPAAPAPANPATQPPTATAPPVAASSSSTAPVPAPQASTNPSGCLEATALSCLPRSSAAVSFENPAAANSAASTNIRDGLSTTQAQGDAVRAGASGKASRLCGIIGSDDSSPLGKHNAAVRLNNLGPADGQATNACMRAAGAFL